MFAARGNVRALDRARRVGRHVSVLAALCGGHRRWLGYACPGGQGGRHEGRGEPRLGADPERRPAPRGDDRALQRRASSASQQTMGRIHENEVRLSTARVNLDERAARAQHLAHQRVQEPAARSAAGGAARRATSARCSSSSQLLDRAQSYNASILGDIRDYRKDVDSSQRVLNRERNARRDTVAELESLKGQIQRLHRGRQAALRRAARQGAAADRGAPPGRDRGLAARRRAAAAAAGRGRPRQAVAVNDIGGVSSAARARARTRRRLGRRSRRPRRSARPRPTSRSASWAPRTSGAAPRRAASTARASSPGPTRRPVSAASRTSPARSGTRARTSRRRATSRPATSSSSTGSATWASTSAAATSCTRRTPATSSRSRTSPATAATTALSASRGLARLRSRAPRRARRGCPRRRRTGASGRRVAVPTP